MKLIVLILGCLISIANGNTDFSDGKYHKGGAQVEKEQEVDLTATSENSYENFMKKKEKLDNIQEAKEEQKDKTNEIKENRAEQLNEQNDGKADEQREKAEESNEADQDRKDEERIRNIDLVDRFLIRPTITWLNLVTGYLPKCPKVEVVQDFSWQRFEGNWYELFRSESNFEEQGECSQMQVQRQGGNFLMTQSEQKMKNGKFFPRSHHQWEIKHQHGALKYDEETEEVVASDGHLMMMKKHVKNSWIPADIIWTDYNNHLLLYSCSLSWGGLIKSERSWVLSRRPLMPFNEYDYDMIHQVSKEKLEQIDSSFDFESKMRPVDQWSTRNRPKAERVVDDPSQDIWSRHKSKFKQYSQESSSELDERKVDPDRRCAYQ